MKKILPRLSMIGLLITLPFGANAMMDEAAAYATVQSLVGSGNSATDIIAALEEDGRTLAESTVFALVSGGEEMRIAFATAGVASASSLLEAQSVVNAVLATAGETGPVADALRVALHSYTKTLPPPPVYTGGNIATGGGAISPSS